MIELAEEWYSFADFSKMFKILSNGGLIRCGTMAFKMDRASNGLIRGSIVAFGKTIDDKTYFSTVTSKLPPKKKKEVKEKAPPKVVDSGNSKKGGLFG